MAYGVLLLFEGVSEDDYWAVNASMGIDEEGSTGWPEALISHTAALTDTGLAVSEIWESKGDQERFLAERLGPALAAAEVEPPSQVIELDVFNYHHPG